MQVPKGRDQVSGGVSVPCHFKISFYFFLYLFPSQISSLFSFIIYFHFTVPTELALAKRGLMVIFEIVGRDILVIEYCGWLIFRGVLIFVVFVEGTIHEFQCPGNCNILHELWKKILWPWILNPANVSFVFNPQKLLPMKIKRSTVL